jgi:oligopeptide/dipeptide ABC transporter ATP-binding protein
VSAAADPHPGGPADPSSGGLLEARGLRVEFATQRGVLHAVRGLDLAVGEAEVLGIVGESGSGKSVTAQALLRLVQGNGRIAGGDVRYRGRDVLAMAPADLRRYRGGEVGIIFQEPGRSFDPIASIGSALEETLRAHRPDLARAETRAGSLALLREARVPRAEERLSSFPHQLSGGLLQRVMVALALAPGPRVLIADEPTTALDVTTQAQIVDLLLDLRERRGLAILFISHNLALVGSIADRILVMYAGVALESGPAGEVLGRPRHPYTRALLDALLQPGDHYSERRLATIPGSVPDPHGPRRGCPFAPRCAHAAGRCDETPPRLASDPDAAAGHVHACLFPGVKPARRGLPRGGRREPDRC